MTSAKSWFTPFDNAMSRSRVDQLASQLGLVPMDDTLGLRLVTKQGNHSKTFATFSRDSGDDNFFTGVFTGNMPPHEAKPMLDRIFDGELKRSLSDAYATAWGSVSDVELHRSRGSGVEID
jgi:hypothetical protein